jgi:hypothetical protein
MKPFSRQALVEHLDKHEEVVEFLEKQAKVLDPRERYLSFEYHSGDTVTFRYYYSGGDYEDVEYLLQDLINATRERGQMLQLERERAWAAEQAKKAERRSAEEYVRAKQLVAQYENQHPGEDIEA